MTMRDRSALRTRGRGARRIGWVAPAAILALPLAFLAHPADRRAARRGRHVSPGALERARESLHLASDSHARCS